MLFGQLRCRGATRLFNRRAIPASRRHRPKLFAYAQQADVRLQTELLQVTAHDGRLHDVIGQRLDALHTTLVGHIRKAQCHRRGEHAVYLNLGVFGCLVRVRQLKRVGRGQCRHTP